ncbi:hypothetical protein ABPG74_018378 [Tetrahymena malaccensis]
MKFIILSLIGLSLLSIVSCTKLDYEICRKNTCGASTICGTDVNCQNDLSTFYTCYNNSVNCQNLYKIWNKMKDQSIVPDSLSGCISDCYGPYKTQQVNSYFTCIKNTCLPLAQQAVAKSKILSVSLLIMLLAALV